MLAYATKYCTLSDLKEIYNSVWFWLCRLSWMHFFSLWESGVDWISTRWVNCAWSPSVGGFWLFGLHRFDFYSGFISHKSAVVAYMCQLIITINLPWMVDIVLPVSTCRDDECYFGWSCQVPMLKTMNCQLFWKAISATSCECIVMNNDCDLTSCSVLVLISVRSQGCCCNSWMKLYEISWMSLMPSRLMNMAFAVFEVMHCDNLRRAWRMLAEHPFFTRMIQFISISWWLHIWNIAFTGQV